MRARNLKPGFFTNDVLAECAPLARILFAGLWCMADRAGRLEDRPKRIKAELLPYDKCDVDALLDELQKHGFIVRYDAAGVGYIQVVEFQKHQEPHVKERASTMPAPDSHGASTVQKPLNPFPDSQSLIPDSKTRARAADPVAEEPDGVLPHVWRDWKLHRGKPLSKEALRRQTERLAELKAMGHDPNAVILQSIERGWSGLFELKAVNGGRPLTPAEEKHANWKRITGRDKHERTIEGTAERVGATAVLPLRDDLREPGCDDVGERGPGRLAAGMG